MTETTEFTEYEESRYNTTVLCVILGSFAVSLIAIGTYFGVNQDQLRSDNFLVIGLPIFCLALAFILPHFFLKKKEQIHE